MSATAAAAIGGVALHQAGEHLDDDELKERAWTELLRQEAVRQGLLSDGDAPIATAPSAREQAVIERMVDAAVQVPVPDEQACRRHHEANAARYVEGQQVRLRHILFAVTEGVDVGRLAQKAEQVLHELGAKDAAPSLFAERARQCSNCPSGASGGELGWVGPNDCAPELANELFLRSAPATIGLRPRLVQTRYGLHIVEIQERRPGRPLAFEAVRARVATQLAQQARATALHQYIRVLAGRARVEGIDLDAVSSPLVQ